MKVYFVRHGQSEANLCRIFSGQSDTRLTAEGRAQAEAIRPILADIPFDKVYSSDLRRARDTQKIVLPGYEAETTKLLREIDVGSLVGTSIAEFAEKHRGVSPTAQGGDYSPYGGENRQMLDARVRQFLDILEQQACENVAVFAHRGVLVSVLRNVLGNVGFSNGAVRCDNCAVNVLAYDGKKWSLLALNYMKKV